MKSIVFIIILTAFVSCDTFETYTVTYEIVNLTEAKINLEFYKYGNRENGVITTLIESVDLPTSGTSIAYSGINTEPSGRPAESTLPNSDSLAIIFNQESVSYHLSGSFEEKYAVRSIYTKYSYEEDPKHYFTYYIQLREYENAIPLDSLK